VSTHQIIVKRFEWAAGAQCQLELPSCITRDVRSGPCLQYSIFIDR